MLCLIDPSWLIHASLGQANAEAMGATDYGFLAAVAQAGSGEKLVMLVLLAFSIISWGIIGQKARMVRRAKRLSEAFLEMFWNSKRLDAIYQNSEDLAPSPVAQVFRAGYIELAKLKKRSAEGSTLSPEDNQLGDLESVQRSMQRALSTELAHLGSHISFLATCGATAPFIGLLGTVIGIINAFHDIGMMGNANLTTVAPSIGGALVATACGLFAAIPAVMAYNFLLSRINTLETEMHNFSADFLNIIKRHFF